jgi:hypothetical protein
MTGRIKAALAIAALALCALPPEARADEAADFLAALAGDWRGRGTAQETAESEPVAVLCRITTELAGDGRSLRNTGKCSSLSAAQAVWGQLAADGSGNVSGNFLQSNDNRVSGGNGRLDGNALAMATQVRTADGALKGSATMRIELSGPGRYELSSKMTDAATGTTFDASSIAFRRLR